MIKQVNWSIYNMKFEESESLTYYEVLQRASSFAAEWLMRERLGWTKTDLVMNYRNTMPSREVKQFVEDFNAYLEGRPMQQIIGHEWFYDYKFKVTADTLIPRPETEEWLDRVLKQLVEEKLNVLDLGTGTGVLGITLKLERPQDQVTATDISHAALLVAQENAEKLGADIVFKEGDLFEPLKGEKFDVVVCNPPYIGATEIEVMDQSVIDYEPKTALFAEDDGLAIYKQIAKEVSEYLNPNAKLYLEIGYQQGEQVAQLFKEQFTEAKVEVWQDFNQLDRVVAVYL